MTHEELLAQARKHWVECSSDPIERENRDRGKQDAKFSAGGDDGAQWHPEVWAERHTPGRLRPCITVNKMGAFLHQVENEVRQNKIAIRISPVDSGIDKDTAAVDQGLVRHIENDSAADAAGHAALVEATRSGLGGLKVVSKYCSDDSFDQKLSIEHIPDAISRLWWDPYSKKPDRTDANYMFEVERISREAFKAQYPDSHTVAVNFFDDLPQAEGWISSDDVLIANYWYFEPRKRKLIYLEATGETVFEDEVKDLGLEQVKIGREREVMQRVLKCAKLNGNEILEESEWPGEIIPLVPVVGEEIMVEGKLKRYSLIHFAKDSQRLFNYYRSGEAEMVGLAPKAPYIGVEGQFEGHEREWKTANMISYAYLEYKNTSLNGTPAPPPQRAQFNPQIEALSIGAMQSNDDMQGSIGIFDASLGKKSNETSGRAILARQAEGDLANLHFIDNLKRAKTVLGLIIVGAKNKFYDTPRMVEILGEDMKPKVVKINAEYVDENGRKRHYRVADTKYNVTVSTGPSYTSARQEAFANMVDYVKAAPDLMPIIGDLIFRNSDMPGADQIADRLNKALPPNLQDDENGPAQIPPAAKAQMDQMAQTVEQLTAALDEATEQINSKKLEIESKERIENLKAKVALITTEAKIGSAEAIALLREEIATIRDRQQLLHADQTVEAEHEHSTQTQLRDQAHADNTLRATQQHERESQETAAIQARESQEADHEQAQKLVKMQPKPAAKPAAKKKD
jgi:hypothetical protein